MLEETNSLYGLIFSGDLEVSSSVRTDIWHQMLLLIQLNSFVSKLFPQTIDSSLHQVIAITCWYFFNIRLYSVDVFLFFFFLFQSVLSDCNIYSWYVYSPSINEILNPLKSVVALTFIRMFKQTNLLNGLVNVISEDPNSPFSFRTYIWNEKHKMHSINHLTGYLCCELSPQTIDSSGRFYFLIGNMC